MCFGFPWSEHSKVVDWDVFEAAWLQLYPELPYQERPKIFRLKGYGYALSDGTQPLVGWHKAATTAPYPKDAWTMAKDLDYYAKWVKENGHG
jgi:hypothetical protein